MECNFSIFYLILYSLISYICSTPMYMYNNVVYKENTNLKDAISVLSVYGTWESYQ